MEYMVYLAREKSRNTAIILTLLQTSSPKIRKAHLDLANMPFEIRPLIANDVEEAAKVGIDCFRPNPFRQVLMPDSSDAEVQETFSQLYRQGLSEPDAHCLQIYDTDAQRMAGFAIWLYTKSKNDEEWASSLAERIAAFPGARQDLLVPFLERTVEAKKAVMGDQRWWGESGVFS